jgi:hypothetical protein
MRRNPINTYIVSSPEDLAVARQLADLVAQQPAFAAEPHHAITAEAPADAAEARRGIAQNVLIVFLLSPEALRVPWLAEVVVEATSIGRGAMKFVVVVALRPYPADPRLDAALHPRRSALVGGSLTNIAIQLADYSTWIPYYSGATMGFRPVSPPPTLEPEPAPERAAPPAPPAPEPGSLVFNTEREDDVGAVPPSAPLPPVYPPRPPAAPPAPEAAPGSAGEAPVDQVSPPAPEPTFAVPPPQSASGTLQFSAYHPNSLAVETWQTLLVYSYLSEALAKIQADAATFTELGSAPTVAKGQAARAVAQGVELIVEPHVDGVTFSPERDTFIWRGEWHRSLFRFSGTAALAGREQSGWIDIYAAPMVPVARIDVSLPFRDGRAQHLATHPPRGIIVTGNVYDAVFISYSHRDAEAFRQACEEYRHFGITVYTDQQLEAGAQYEQELGRMIEEANVFHLLWSPHSSRSPECRKEWLAALRREPSERFIKPWFWKQPLDPPPTELVAHRISFKYERLRRSLWRPSTWFV